MPLASALELVLGHYDIYDVDSLVAILRSPHDASGVADLIDGSRALIDATAGTAHVNVQTECATVTVGTTMESVISVREVGSMATFSPTSGARMVSMQVQCSPQPPQMVERAVQVKAPAVRNASVTASVSTANASTSHYLVVGVGLQHGSSQTEMPEQAEPEQPEPEQPEPEAAQPEPEQAEPEPEQPKPEQAEPEVEQPETEVELPAPPVFADCSHYNASPRTSRGRGRRRARVSVW